MRTLLNKLRWHRKKAPAKPQIADARPPEPETAKPEPGKTHEAARPAPPIVDPRSGLERKCWKLGYREARARWDLEPDKATEAALQSQGVALAIAIHRPPSEANDQRQLEKYKALLAEHKRRMIPRDRTDAVAQSLHRELAALGPARPRPTMSSLLRHSATLGLTISIAPTLHDMVTGLDPFLKWLIGGVSAWGLSLLIIQGLTPDTAHAEPPPTAGHQA